MGKKLYTQLLKKDPESYLTVKIKKSSTQYQDRETIGHQMFKISMNQGRQKHTGQTTYFAWENPIIIKI